MKCIELVSGEVTIVDDEDYKELNKHNWYYSKGYAKRSLYADKKQTTIAMHRIILNTPDDMETDHINCNKLDNRKENLRVCTHAENQCNKRKYKNNTSGHKGVVIRGGKFIPQIKHNNKLIHLGTYNTLEQAAEIYTNKAKELFGKFVYQDTILNDMIK